MPRRFSWHGRVPARALFFSSSLPNASARALAAFRPGARLCSLDGGLLLVLPPAASAASSEAARFGPASGAMDARTAEGEVFVDVDGIWSSLPLTKAERASLARGDVVRAVGGRVVAHVLSSLPEVPAGALVDASALFIADVISLGAPAPVVPIEPPRPRVSARAQLLGDDAPNPQRDSVARALRGEPPLPEDRLQGVAGASDADQGALRRAQQRAAQGLPTQGFGETLMRALVSALETTGLMDRLRAAQRKYVEDTLEALRSGSLEDALKRAVPLARPGGGGARAPAMRIPGVRPGLDINMGARTPSTTSITVEDDLFERMRNGYREAAKKLAKDKRWREAAFVYVELLGEPREGVAVLERSEDRAMFRLAAELAESHDLGADLTVRLWVRARDIPRAVSVARRHRAFATAVIDLDRTGDRESATLLRQEWAAHLARTGAFSTAVEVLWPYVSSSDGVRGEVRQLLDAGIAVDGQDLPSLVARRMQLDATDRPGEPPRDLERFFQLVHDDGPEAASARTQLAYSMGDAAPALRSSTSSLMRALCADVAADASQVNLKVLAERLADASLRADLPAQPVRPPRRHPAEILVLSGAPGRTNPVDVALLAGGRLLVAAGEAGAFVVTRKGGVASRSGEPCERIVLHDSGARALLVVPRGELMRIGRYEMGSGASSHWLDVRAHAIAASTDGDVVFLARNDEVIAIDAVADVARVLWQTTLPGPAEGLARDPTSLAVVWAAENARVGTFDGRSLARRDEWALPALHDVMAINSRGDVVGVDWPQQPQVTPPGSFALNTPPGSTPTQSLALARDLAAVAFEGDNDNGVVAQVRGGVRLVMHLDGARVTAMRAQESLLVVSDDRGRAFVIDVARGELVHRVALP